MKKQILFTMYMIVLLVLLVGCSKTAPTSVVAMDRPLKEIHIQMSNWNFVQDPVMIKKGDQVRLLVTSKEGTHGIMIPDLGLSTDRIAPGEEQTLEFVAQEAGTFQYYCNVPCGPGHRSMRGQLVVEP